MSQVVAMATIRRHFRRLLVLCVICGIVIMCRRAYLQSLTPKVAPRHTLWETRYIGVVRNTSLFGRDGELHKEQPNIHGSASVDHGISGNHTDRQQLQSGHKVNDASVHNISGVNRTADHSKHGNDQLVNSKSTNVISDKDSVVTGHTSADLSLLIAPDYVPGKFTLKEDEREYTRLFHNKHRCLLDGINAEQMVREDVITCKCKLGWHGGACSIPELVFVSDYPHEYAAMLRRTARRILYGMPFSNEFDLLEAKIQELYNIVDVFLVLESNYTASGEANERSLLRNLGEGYLKQFRDKIVYISMSEYPKTAYRDGWIIDRILRTRIGDAIKSHIEVRHDDVIIVTDVDELPLPEALLFIKLHDGFPEPFGFVLRHNVYGFFWRGREDDQTSNIFGGATFGYLDTVVGGDLYQLRTNAYAGHGHDVTDTFWRRHRGVIHPWLFGTWQLPAGWHCSWCLRPEAIRHKLFAAHISDTPRWGSIPGKTDIAYIKSLIDNGVWFDDKKQFYACTIYEEDFAPRYILQNREKYDYLLQRPVNDKEARFR